MHGRAQPPHRRARHRVALPPRPPRRHRRRGERRRRRRHPRPGPRPRSCARCVDFELPAERAPTPSAARSCPPTRTSARRAMAAIEKIVAERGADRPRLARRAARRLDDRADGRATSSRRSAAVPRRDAATPLRGIDARPARVRRRASASSTRRPGTVYFASLSARTLVYKGMLITGQLTEFYPDLADDRFESALALVHSTVLDQHVPVVAARAPVPYDRPQRRDQHGDGQRELDARPRGAARQRPSARASIAPSRSARRARPTRAASTRCSSCCTSAAARCRTRC